MQLLHGKSRALPTFSDLQHRSKGVEQTVSICDIRSLKKTQFPRHIIQRLKGDEPSVLSIPEAPPPVYQKMWLRGYYWSFGQRSTRMFEGMFAMLDFLEIHSCYHTDTMIKATIEGHDFTRLKTFKVLNSIGSETNQKEDFNQFLASFNGLEELTLGNRGLGLYTTDTISAHNDSLKTLELYDQLYDHRFFRGSVLSSWFLEEHSSRRAQRLSSILQNCSQLRSLHVDMLEREIQHKVGFRTPIQLHTDFVTHSPLQWSKLFVRLAN